MVPASFQTHRALKILNVGAVGFALAAVVAAAFTGMFDSDASSLVTGIPTWILGTVWAWVLRVPKGVGNSSFRWGWVASMPLAILNAAIAAGLLFGFGMEGSHEAHAFDAGRFVYGALLGGTLGVFVWLPALIATMVCFGVPIAWAQRLAGKGLAVEERGEWIVGLVCVVMSLVGLTLSLGWTHPHDTQAALAGALVTRGFATLGAFAGAASTALAFAREARRRRFVADAEAGNVAGYRVDPTEEGKVLVRIVAQGNGYRVADFEEEIFDLDARGEAVHAKRLEGALAPR